MKPMILLLSLLACSPDPGDDTGDSCQPGAVSVVQGMSMVRLCPGGFTMGSPSDEVGRGVDEEQRHVTLSRGFLISQHEVTRTEYDALAGDKDWRFIYSAAVEDPDTADGYIRSETAQAFANLVSEAEGLPSCYSCRESEGTPGQDDPLVYVSCELDEQWATPYDCPGYRLPTEAEWEYAARAGTGTAFSNGANLLEGDEHACDGELELDDGSVLDDFAVYCGNTDPELTISQGRESLPATLAPNPWGLYDMHGNLMEWVEDYYLEELEDDATDPWTPPHEGTKVIRGGSWFNTPRRQRSAWRGWMSPVGASNLVGYRLVRTE
jgi:formylglycine-generating enzyme required for sulfatase activity